MKYIEEIIFANLIIHIILTYLVGYIMKHRINKILLFISVVFDSVFVLLYLLRPYAIDSIKYVVIFIIAILPFINKGVTKAFSDLLIYLMCSFTLGGIDGVLIKCLNSPYVIYISLLIIFISYLFIFIYRELRSQNEYYEIIIKDNRKLYRFTGFLDTGCSLTCDGISVVILSNKYKLGRLHSMISVSTINKTSLMPVYKVDEFKIKIDKKFIQKDVYVAFSKQPGDLIFGLSVLRGG